MATTDKYSTTWANSEAAKASLAAATKRHEARKSAIRKMVAGYGAEIQPLPPSAQPDPSSPKSPVIEAIIQAAKQHGYNDLVVKQYVANPLAEQAAPPPLEGVMTSNWDAHPELTARALKKGAEALAYPEPEDGKLVMNIETTKINKIVKYIALPEAVLDVSGMYAAYSHYLTERKADVPRCRIPTIVGKNKDTLVGLELELEGMDTHTKFAGINSGASAEYLNGLVKKVWNITKDDSLRDQGAEWVSKVGLTAEHAGKALCLLKLHLDAYYSKLKLNYRCGTHVHVNVRDFTVEQLINMTMLYILFEDLFYKVSGERYKNIFCVPIRASTANVEQLFKLATVSRPTYQDFRDVFKHFTKYMAFNLLPAGRATAGSHVLGTVEFRHHKGESDPTVLTSWLQYILDIHQAAQEYTFKELSETIFNLNTASNYVAFARSVFNQPLPIKADELALDMYDGSGHIKELYIQAKGL